MLTDAYFYGIRDTLARDISVGIKLNSGFKIVNVSDLENILCLLDDLKGRLDRIENMAREAFSDPATDDINLYRAQALANIFAIFEYDGKTIKEDTDHD